MNKRYVPIIGFTVALLLVSGIVYAADKKKKTRLVVSEPGEMSEDSLRDELLADNEAQLEKILSTKVTNPGKSAAAAKGKVKKAELDSTLPE